ncbi:MAG: VOC family protein [Rhodoferax sp.]|nr:VOC family protein [Rhodoferax sp.]MBP9929131.1 VOC family protein [Rhodoferax sp.]HQX58531.1 VOC family protein [Burkholderiaceae bacterium]HQZ05312.1 VOC family protein [Burkholderiaceae bacterium]HRA62444.1 VOC family protein [Burkholderiaceae bacterium]
MTQDTAPSVHLRPHGAAVLARGLHHLALNTDDMKMTIDFYAGVLGMPLVHALKVPPGLGTGPGNRGNPPFENLRHYFFDMGGDSLLAFFEMPRGAKGKGDRDALAAMQHCAFAVTEERFHQLCGRLKNAGVPLTGPIPVGAGTWSVYFFDPNGIRLEFSYQQGDGADVRVVARWTQTRDQALAELRSLSDDTRWLEHVTAHLPAGPADVAPT